MPKLHRGAPVWAARLLSLSSLWIALGTVNALGDGLGIFTDEVWGPGRAAREGTSERPKVHRTVSRLFREGAPPLELLAISH